MLITLPKGVFQSSLVMFTIATRILQMPSSFIKNPLSQAAIHSSYVGDVSSLLKACTDRKSLMEGKRLHGQVIKSGLINFIFEQTLLLVMYTKCGSSVDACTVFDEMPEKNLLSCNALISGLARNGRLEDARRVFLNMRYKDVVSWNSMLSAYAENGYITDAWQVFKKMPFKNLISWNSMVSSLFRYGLLHESLQLFREMRKIGMIPNEVSITTVLMACQSLCDLEFGRQVRALTEHLGLGFSAFVDNALLNMYARCGELGEAYNVFEKADKSNVIIWNSMLNAYVQCGMLEEAETLFWQMPKKNTVSWTAMISGFARNDSYDKALRLFVLMMQQMSVRPNQYTYCIAMRTCTSAQNLQIGKQVHASLIKAGFELDEHVSRAVIEFYIKCNKVDDARQEFSAIIDQVASNRLQTKSSLSSEIFQVSETILLSANMMIAAYGRGGRISEAVELFERLSEKSLASWNTMITVYTENRALMDARKLFNKMPHRDSISWNALIAGYIKIGDFGEALKLFLKMQSACVKWNRPAFCNALNACAGLVSVEKGKRVHSHILKCSFEKDVCVSTSLVDMYAKCGNIGDAFKVFDKMRERNEVLWTAMISGCARHGLAGKALLLFERMQNDGVQPNQVTFVSVLWACSHAGLISMALQHFSLMSKYSIMPLPEHYACIVDLFCRSGMLQEALDLINRMPFKADAVIWSALLNACSVYRNSEIGRLAGERLLELESDNPSTYVLLFNFYTATGQIDHAINARIRMQGMVFKKKPGCSWIEIKSGVYGFSVGD